VSRAIETSHRVDAGREAVYGDGRLGDSDLALGRGRGVIWWMCELWQIPFDEAVAIVDAGHGR